MGTPLLNNAQVREYAFAAVLALRPALAKKKTRVSDDFYEAIEARLRTRIFADARAAEARSDLKTLRVADEAMVIERDPALPWLVNQSQVHQYATDAIHGTALTKVSGGYPNSCDSFVRSAINARISSMLSVGKTIQ